VTVENYTLTISAGVGGTTDPAPGTYYNSKDAEVSITATADPGYEFEEWIGNVSSGHENDNPIIITMDSNKSITAKFYILNPQVTISGTVTSGGSGLEDVTIIFSRGGGTATTGSNGSYSHSVSYGWSGMATPSLAGYIFEPTSIEYKNVSSDYVNQDYTAAIITPTISGSVKTSDGTGIEGILIDGLPGGPTTDSSGNYSTTVDYGWSGTATPYKEKYTFSPISQDYSNVTSDQSDQDYTGTLIQFTLTINATTGGTTVPSPGTYTLDSGAIVLITALPSNGYNFNGWSGDSSGNKNPITITMDPNKSIKANFIAIEEGDGKSKSPFSCFIATAAYGSPLHPHLDILRDFRDKYLMPTKIGRMLVNLYYKYSPSVANIIAENKALKVIVRNQLVPFVAFSYIAVHFGPIIITIILVLILAIPIFSISFRRRKRI